MNGGMRMEQIIRAGAEEAGKELARNANVNISLEGWPCAVAILGLGIAYVISIKIKCDAQGLPVEHDVEKAA